MHSKMQSFIKVKQKNYLRTFFNLFYYLLQILNIISKVIKYYHLLGSNFKLKI